MRHRGDLGWEPTWPGPSRSAGSQVELDGVFVLDFSDGGVCVLLQEWWLAREESWARGFPATSPKQYLEAASSSPLLL